VFRLPGSESPLSGSLSLTSRKVLTFFWLS
jgi:hypothetical protein